MRSISTKRLILGLVYAILASGAPFLAKSQIGIQNPIKANSFGEVVQAFASLLVSIGIPLAAIFIVWSGFLFVSARGNPEQITKAKNVFWWTIVGTALIVGAYAIATAIVNFAQQL